MKVLLADDDRITRTIIAARLAKWGYEVVIAENGLEAWAILQAPDAPSLAIVDWMMPGLDGVELCRRVRQQAREPYVYVVLLTARSEKVDLIEGLRAGADDYLTKPVESQELEVRIRGGKRIVELHARLIESRQAMWHQATHDGLTGAWNRPAGLDALAGEIVRCAREGTNLASAIVDLDHFKRINDTYGHLGGDETLREAVRRMTKALRPCDTLARYGGEEFLVIFPGCDQDQGIEVAESLRRALGGSPMTIGDASAVVTCSIGIATFDGDPGPAALMRRADDALYSAKRTGRDRVVLAPAAGAAAKLAS